ncbi:MAG TPA: hypothetical protein VGD23_01620 [Sphingomicrobium sp.]
MKPAFYAAAAIGALTATPAPAQHTGHEGHQPAQPAPAEEHQHHAPQSAPEPKPEAPAQDHGTMDHSAHQASSGDPTHAEHGMVLGPAMAGALGLYPMAREASGTAWQPDTSKHGGLHLSSGEWTLMAHGNVDLIHSWQEKPRGASKTFVAGMLMGMARRPIGNGTLQFKAMVSPDPLMGKRGYPLLLASGETADGVEPLIDRQHPHDFFMELSASISQRLSDKTSVFLYGGLPGEPAFGPPAFMHRQSISASPEAPISHHWLDSTHITFGVLTAGLIHGNAKVEVSRFNGREPDQHRWNIETGPLDSTSVRLSWNPTSELALQGSWGSFKDSEQLEPGVDQKRWSASGTYTRAMANGWWSTTLAWGRKAIEGHSFDAYLLESSLGWKDWTLFGRGEITENNELIEGEDGHHGEAFRVGKVSLGLVRDIRIAPNLKLGLGGLYAFNFVPEEIEPVYGGDPNGAMAFVRLKLD